MAILIFGIVPAFGGVVIAPDNVKGADRLLETSRKELLDNKELEPAIKAQQMLDLGMWQEAYNLLATVKKRSRPIQVAEARYHFLTNNFLAAENLVKAVLKKEPDNIEAKILEVELATQAWQLNKALLLCNEILADDSTHQRTFFLKGNIYILQKKITEAKKVFEKMKVLNRQSALAYLLESEVYFWNQEPEKAETPLKRCLELDPLNADARFKYGYAIWRKVDARLLRKMADQWELALKINPMHYLTHWHWGNGHTHLTYADYGEYQEQEIRERLSPAEDLIEDGKIKDAILLASEVAQAYPRSVIPELYIASYHYISYDLAHEARLDSAEARFKTILARKKHYGPAHNGLAAVIKSKRFRYLHQYDSIEASIKAIEVPATDLTRLSALFPELTYYPGKRVKHMVWSSLRTARAYFPMLAKLNRVFRVQPLHIDLAAAMGDPYFRTSTTFDNRQWMDIRGVGSGAAGIEYVERGAHLERNVLLHEFSHLFHELAFTDSETRRVRQLYYKAVETGKAIDYYSANNEHEYFAQAFPAYFASVKVHPLNHKSMNVRADLSTQDPEMFAFIQGLVARQRAVISGDTKVFASNWAQVYINLARQQMNVLDGSSGLALAQAYLDSALMFDSQYLPIFVAYSEFEALQGNVDEAENWLAKAKIIDPEYAPIYIQKASINKKKGLLGLLDAKKAFEAQKDSYLSAIDLEADLMYRATYVELLYNFYLDHNYYLEAIALAKNHAEQTPAFSTYLRDTQYKALAFAAWLKGHLGYGSEMKSVMHSIVEQHPQDYDLIAQYADVLAAAYKYKEAIAALESAQKILSAAGTLNADFMARVAENYLWMNYPEGAQLAIEPLLSGMLEYQGDLHRMARVYAGIGKFIDAQQLIQQLNNDLSTPKVKAEHYYTLGVVEAYMGNINKAIEYLEQATDQNPYHLRARLELVKQYSKAESSQKAIGVLQGAMQLDVPLGPDFNEQIKRYISF